MTNLQVGRQAGSSYSNEGVQNKRGWFTVLRMAAAVHGSTVRPSEAKKVRASENTTQRLDLIKILHMWRDEPKMKEL